MKQYIHRLRKVAVPDMIYLSEARSASGGFRGAKDAGPVRDRYTTENAHIFCCHGLAGKNAEHFREPEP